MIFVSFWIRGVRQICGPCLPKKSLSYVPNDIPEFNPCYRVSHHQIFKKKREKLLQKSFFSFLPLSLSFPSFTLHVHIFLNINKIPFSYITFHNILLSLQIHTHTHTQELSFVTAWILQQHYHPSDRKMCRRLWCTF